MFIDGIRQAIDEQPTVNEWIPCSERLPKKHGKYLVTIQPYRLDMPSKKSGEPITNFQEFDANGKRWKTAHFLPVIAWMSLPEPWKGE